MHPDQAQEQRHLERTQDQLEHEDTLAQADYAHWHDTFEDLYKHSGGAFSDDLMLAASLSRHYGQVVRNITLARVHPYFTRVDFTPNDGEPQGSYYIGKYGVFDSQTQQPFIVDWRSPVANLYYSGQIGPMSYRAPDGLVEGELTLKRQFDITGRTLHSFFDTDIVGQEAYLQQALQERSGDTLRDIVTTIQREQNDVIRIARERPVVVQGVAGSGKTTIALHRIAYLLYTFQDALAPSNMMILAPNPLFLRYIENVLPDLGVEEVLQITFEGLAERLLGQHNPKLSTIDRLSLLIDPKVSDEQKSSAVTVARLKGSLTFLRALEQYLAHLEETLVPPGDAKLGPVTIYSGQQMRTMFLEDLKPFALSVRISQIQKHLKGKARQAGERVVQLIEEECARLADRLRMLEDTPQRAERMRTLYTQRDEKILQAREQARAFPPQFARRWPKLQLLGCYEDFWREDAPWAREAGIDAWQWRLAREETLGTLQKKRVTQEDLPALLVLVRALFGFAERFEIRHAVLDEAQDFSEFQFELLRRITGNASFTIVGDISQGIHGYRGIASWRQALDRVFESSAPNYLTLSVSYRNTVEIMEYAARVAARYPFEGQVPARPVLRHGPPPELIRCQEHQRPDEVVALLLDSLQEYDFHSVALITRTAANAAALHMALEKHCPGRSIRLLTGREDSYDAGIMVLPAPLAKGLEFDAVVVCDVEQYADTALDARLLYVCLTRPLHRLFLVSSGPAVLLEG